MHKKIITKEHLFYFAFSAVFVSLYFSMHPLQRELINPVGCFMAYVHATVNQISKIYLQNEKRYNYTTPKTFLEYIFLYRKLLVDRSGEHTSRIKRLQSGMAKLAECARQVDALKVRKIFNSCKLIRYVYVPV